MDLFLADLLFLKKLYQNSMKIVRHIVRYIIYKILYINIGLFQKYDPIFIKSGKLLIIIIIVLYTCIINYYNNRLLILFLILFFLDLHWYRDFFYINNIKFYFCSFSILYKNIVFNFDDYNFCDFVIYNIVLNRL